MRDEYQPDLLSSSSDDRDLFVDRLSAFMAPVAADAGAISKDPATLLVAEAVHAAFGDAGSPDGLTRSELAAACAGVAPSQAFESRFELFVGLGMLQRSRDKRYDHKYVFNPASSAALLVYERLSEVGGVQEIVMLLDRIRDALRQGSADQDSVERMLTKVRRELSINADHLRHLVRSGAFDQLIAERRHHQAGDQLLEDAREVVKLAAERFPRLKVIAVQLVLAALLADQDTHGRVLILDELGNSLGDVNRKDVLSALRTVAARRQVTILGTCQDSVLADAAEVCGELLWFTHASASDPYNRPTHVWGYDASSRRVELTADWVRAGRGLV